MSDEIDHPDYYNNGEIEAIDVIEDWELNFNLGNVIKYICRAGKKIDALLDLEKAAWYIDREIERRKKYGNHPDQTKLIEELAEAKEKRC